jgi:multidrug resistance efflux pump
MVSWLIPALKAVLPHVDTIISLAKPVFTKKKPDSNVDPADLVQEQIAELQAAAAQNAAHIQELAEQLQRTVAALQQAATVAEIRLRRTLILSSVAVSISFLAMCLALFIAYTRASS